MSMYDRVLEFAESHEGPHAVFAERAILAMWLDLGKRPSACRRLVSQDFTFPWHRELFSYLRQLDEAGDPTDVLAVQQELTRRKVAEGAKHLDLAEMIEMRPVTNAGTGSWYRDQILDAALVREEIDLGLRLSARPDDAEASHREHQKRVSDIRDRATDVEPDRFATHVNQALFRYSTGLHPAIPTGLPDLDLLIEGLRPGGVTVLASRPGIGKSLLVTTIAANICIHERARVGFISLEMSAEEVQDRLIAGETGIPVKTLRHGGDALTTGDWQAIDAACERIEDWPLDVEARAHDQARLRAYAERLAAQSPRSVLIVDYLQRVQETGGAISRERHVSQVSNTLKDIAVDLDIAVLAVASMSREQERRGGRPRMSDLRDSGTIESDADVVILLWQDNPESIDSNIVDGIVDKNRHGPLGETQFIRRGEVGRMANLGRPGASNWQGAA